MQVPIAVPLLGGSVFLQKQNYSLCKKLDNQVVLELHSSAALHAAIHHLRCLCRVETLPW